MDKPIIFLDDYVFRKIMAYAASTRNEFSGFGFCQVLQEENGIFVYDFVVCDVGTYAETTVKPETLMNLLQREDANAMKVWIHRHPVGNGVPGFGNWSGTDEFAITKKPLGGTPDAIKWSVSIVLTPKGLVGRLDRYKKGKVKTTHLEVVPNIWDFNEEIATNTPKSQVKSILDDMGHDQLFFELEGLNAEMTGFEDYLPGGKFYGSY